MALVNKGNVYMSSNGKNIEIKFGWIILDTNFGWEKNARKYGY